jgi:hypothetical protein
MAKSKAVTEDEGYAPAHPDRRHSFFSFSTGRTWRRGRNYEPWLVYAMVHA